MGLITIYNLNCRSYIDVIIQSLATSAPSAMEHILHMPWRCHYTLYTGAPATPQGFFGADLEHAKINPAPRALHLHVTLPFKGLLWRRLEARPNEPGAVDFTLYVLRYPLQGFFSADSEHVEMNPAPWAADMGQDFAANGAVEGIDFVTVHVWPDNWKK
jgi:hypothetical protein